MDDYFLFSIRLSIAKRLLAQTTLFLVRSDVHL